MLETPRKSSGSSGGARPVTNQGKSVKSSHAAADSPGAQKTVFIAEPSAK